MSLKETPRGERIHIGLFGRRNSGKSSIINRITGQDISIVSEVKGTTTDPVFKSIEILPLGPCVIIDTAGIDDEGDLGQLRIRKTFEVLDSTDIALVVVDVKVGLSKEDTLIIEKIKEKKIPLILVLNKIDLTSDLDEKIKELKKFYTGSLIPVSAIKKQGIRELKDEIISAVPQEEDKLRIVGDLVDSGDIVVLVTPIDKAAPKGRLILPQQQAIRDILDSDAVALVTKENQLSQTLESLNKKPKLVITDSQVFNKVALDTPRDIPLTSFSILFARHKGNLIDLVKGAKAIDRLKDGDRILIAEGCSHHRQSDDIGTVKIPKWLRQYTGKKLEFDFASGVTFTDEVKKYSLIVHCGACMMNRAAMVNRIEVAKNFNVPIVNYGVLIAYVQGIFPRVLEPFPSAKMVWEDEDDLY